MFLAYALMTIRSKLPDTFSSWAAGIIELAPGIDKNLGKELLRELLIVKGGKGKPKQGDA